jgi:hypothetical protein
VRLRVQLSVKRCKLICTLQGLGYAELNLKFLWYVAAHQHGTAATIAACADALKNVYSAAYA